MAKPVLHKIEADLRAGILNNWEIARLRGVNWATVRHWRRKLELPSHKVGRRHPMPSDRADIEAKLVNARRRLGEWERLVAKLERILSEAK